MAQKTLSEAVNDACLVWAEERTTAEQDGNDDLVSDLDSYLIDELYGYYINPTTRGKA